jgi:hypothetical protein
VNFLAGVLACNYIEEAGNASEDEKCGVVDEAEAAATYKATSKGSVQTVERHKGRRSGAENALHS